MKRTFIAIPVSNETRRQIMAIRQAIPELRENVRLVPPENIHLTLKFLGDTDEEMIPDIGRRIAALVADFTRFGFVCEKTGCFPNPYKPRILWLGVTEGFTQIQTLASQIELAMSEFGFQPEGRAFQPHLTLGRVKDPRRPVAGLESFLKNKFNPTNNPVENVIFYESNLTSGGAIYSRLAVFNLK